MRPALLASSFEALVGAIYLELGFDEVRDWLLREAAPEIELDIPASSLKSPKSQLQEHTQRTTGARPIYRVVDATGPDHERTFEIEVEVGGSVLGSGRGPSRRVAETAAALMALEAIQSGTAADAVVEGIHAPSSEAAGEPAPASADNAVDDDR
jgi:ribonuclease-3